MGGGGASWRVRGVSKEDIRGEYGAVGRDLNRRPADYETRHELLDGWNSRIRRQTVKPPISGSLTSRRTMAKSLPQRAASGARGPNLTHCHGRARPRLWLLAGKNTNVQQRQHLVCRIEEGY